MSNTVILPLYPRITRYTATYCTPCGEYMAECPDCEAPVCVTCMDECPSCETPMW